MRLKKNSWQPCLFCPGSLFIILFLNLHSRPWWTWVHVPTNEKTAPCSASLLLYATFRLLPFCLSAAFRILCRNEGLIRYTGGTTYTTAIATAAAAAAPMIDLAVVNCWVAIYVINLATLVGLALPPAGAMREVCSAG
ncbi:hypothetical protein GGI43DRAFT_272243 [Trichoderma evansii]